MTANDDAAAQIMAELMNVTIDFRDRLKERDGTTLTVEDTQAALAAYEAHLKREEADSELTDVQQELLELFIEKAAGIE